MIKLYDLVGRDDRRFSPSCWRIKLALSHKGVPFETAPVPFTGIAAIGGGVTTTLPCIEDAGRLIADSGAIADHLEVSFPESPTLFGGESGRALSRFVDMWVLAALHGRLVTMIVHDIHEHLLDVDKPYFRESRERRLGRRLEDVQADRETRLDGLRAELAPLRALAKRQPFLGGETPLYADYMVLGAFQWVRSVSAFKVLADDDPIRDYLRRLAARNGGIAERAEGYAL